MKPDDTKIPVNDCGSGDAGVSQDELNESVTKDSIDEGKEEIHETAREALEIAIAGNHDFLLMTDIGKGTKMVGYADERVMGAFLIHIITETVKKSISRENPLAMMEDIFRGRMGKD